MLIDADNKPIAQGSHEWKPARRRLWTYSIEAIWYGLQDCYANLRANVRELYDVEIEQLAAIGVSAMMHGYMPFNAKGEILVPFRTWRNTNTGKAAAELSELFVYNIPCAGASAISIRLSSTARSMWAKSTSSPRLPATSTGSSPARKCSA